MYFISGFVCLYVEKHVWRVQIFPSIPGEGAADHWAAVWWHHWTWLGHVCIYVYNCITLLFEYVLLKYQLHVSELGLAICPGCNQEAPWLKDVPVWYCCPGEVQRSSEGILSVLHQYCWYSSFSTVPKCSEAGLFDIHCVGIKMFHSTISSLLSTCFMVSSH